jgi:hypothetical protein
MIGILVLLALSWLILHYVEKENLSVLRVYPTIEASMEVD